MGLFSRKKKAAESPQGSGVEHPLVERTIYLKASPDVVAPHLEGYATIMGPNARDLPLVMDRAGEWLRLALPLEGVHPYECNNLAYWLHELGDIVVVSAASPTFPSHWLVRAPGDGDLLEGWTEDGTAIGLHVPSGKVVRLDAEVSEPRCGVVDKLTELGVALSGWEAIEVLPARSEDPGRDLNPGLTETVRDRKALEPFFL